ncbi:MAG: type II secretion system protein [Candidatus Margulisiibacteriota bacterium]
MNKGYTLIEVLVAAALLFLFSFGSLSIFKQTGKITDQEQYYANSIAVAQKALAEIELADDYTKLVDGPDHHFIVTLYAENIVKIDLIINSLGHRPLLLSTLRRAK